MDFTIGLVECICSRLSVREISYKNKQTVNSIVLLSNLCSETVTKCFAGCLKNHPWESLSARDSNVQRVQLEKLCSCDLSVVPNQQEQISSIRASQQQV